MLGVVLIGSVVNLAVNFLGGRLDAPGVAKDVPRNSTDSEVESGAHGTAVARLARTVDCSWSNSPLLAEDNQGTTLAGPKSGDGLTSGSKLFLRAGLVEIAFNNGARTILEGPAVLEIRSPGTAVLARGKLAVTVEIPSARGFVVETPGMKYTDLGTEFGLKVAENAEQEVHVFRGEVRAEQGTVAAREGRQDTKEPQSPPAAITGFSPLVLSAHEAIRVAAPDALGRPAKTIERIAADEKLFVRIVREPFTLFSTGAGLDRGSQDPHWTITTISTDPAFTPQPAFVVDWEASPKHTYAATDARAQRTMDRHLAHAARHAAALPDDVPRRIRFGRL